MSSNVATAACGETRRVALDVGAERAPAGRDPAPGEVGAGYAQFALDHAPDHGAAERGALEHVQDAERVAHRVHLRQARRNRQVRDIPAQRRDVLREQRMARRERPRERREHGLDRAVEAVEALQQRAVGVARAQVTLDVHPPLQPLVVHGGRGLQLTHGRGHNGGRR